MPQIVAPDVIAADQPIERLATRLDPRRSAFFFDVDGTLIEIEQRPDQVTADPHLRDLLRELALLSEGAVAFVSGRSTTDIDRIFAPLVFPTAGLHGAEIRYPDGRLRTTDPRLMDHARPHVRRFVDERPGLLLEDKGPTLAVHFRLAPALGPSVLAFLSAFAPGDDIAVQEGKMVVELKPALFDKGTAIARLLDDAPFAGRRPIFFGDDLTDESGFAFVNKAQGYSVRIGSPETPTEALFHLPSAADLQSLIERLVAAPRDHS